MPKDSFQHFLTKNNCFCVSFSYGKRYEALKIKFPGSQAEALNKNYQYLRESCPVFHRIGTAKLEAALQLYDETPQKSDTNSNGTFSKILFLFLVAIYAVTSVV